MPRATTRKNGGGWSQGPPLSSEQYYLTQYKSYNDCYPMARPGTIQSNGLNPDLAQTGFAGGARRQRSSKRSSQRSKRSSKRKVGGSSCAEYFRTRGGMRSTKRSTKRNSQRKVGGSSCAEYFRTRGGMRKRSTSTKRSSMRSNRKSGGCGCMMHGGAFIYGDCPYKANSFDCPYAKGGMQRMQKKNKTRRNLKGGRYGIDPSVSVGGDGPNVAPMTAHVPCEAYRPMPINPHHPTDLVSAPETGIHFAGLSPGAVLKGGARRKHKGGLRGDEHPLAYTAPRAGFTFFPNIAQGQTLNPGQIPYQVTVPVDGSNSAACGLTCGQAIAHINKA